MRYELHEKTFCDMQNNRVLIGFQGILNELNELNTDRENLMQRNTELGNQVETLQRKNTLIKNTIKALMETERTRRGYNALKQAYEAIQ